MTPDHIRELIAVATPAPLEVLYSVGFYAGQYADIVQVEDGLDDAPIVVAQRITAADAELIVALVNAAPALLDQLEAKDGEIQRLRDALDEISKLSMYESKNWLEPRVIARAALAQEE